MPFYSSRDGSVRSRIAELHAADCNRSLKSVARELGCNEKYVSTVYSQLGLRVGVPYSHRDILPETMQGRLINKWTPKPRNNDTCRYITLQDGRPTECGEQTGGKVYCLTCQERTQSLGANRYKSFLSV
jgi:hypothetical protein